MSLRLSPGFAKSHFDRAVVTSIIGGMEKSDCTGILFPIVHLALLDHNFANPEKPKLGYTNNAEIQCWTSRVCGSFNSFLFMLGFLGDFINQQVQED
ncbi:hypothetical protein ACJRO7_034208 [Eucalyptus globulus]|uniref:Uncharacterized protein n=1 Tax=Eucalyptus globulus TaxID=34317 RepID=A0ABD3J5P9_EUCGL